MSDALLRNLEIHRMEKNPEQYRKDLEEGWNRVVRQKVHMLRLTRTIEGKDNKDFQKLRKVIEKKLGYKITKERGSLIIETFSNEIMLSATNNEERIKRNLVFLYLRHRIERRKVSGSAYRSHRDYLEKNFSNLICESFFDLLPDAEWKDCEEYLSSNIEFDDRVEPFGKNGSHHRFFEDDEEGHLYFGYDYGWDYEMELPFGHDGAFSWKDDIPRVWNREKMVHEDLPEKEYLNALRTTKDQCEKIYANFHTINIKDFLSVFPEIEKEIAEEVSRKLTLTKTQVVVSASYNISFTVDVECEDATDMKEKLETILQRGLENAGVPIETTYGGDAIRLAEPDLEKSLDFQFVEVSTDASNDETVRNKVA